MCSCALSFQVHFILRHQNPVTGKWEEKHAKNPPAIKGDQKTHLYTLVIRPDNSFEIFIDKESAKKGRYVPLHVKASFFNLAMMHLNLGSYVIFEQLAGGS